MNKKLFLAAAAILLATLLSACATATPAQPTTTPQATTPPPATSAPGVTFGPGDYQQSIDAGGMTREIILHIPAGYDGSKALPLVLLLHGYTDTAEHMVEWSGMSDKADQEHFIAVYLKGTGNPTAWNTGIIPGLAQNADDVGFARAVIARMERDLKVDDRRVYAAGASMGAMMTYRLAAELSDRLAAAAMQAGTVGTMDRGGLLRTVVTTGGPIPVVTFHGKLDKTVPYDGGPGDAGAGLNWLSAADSTAFSLRQDGCAGSPTVTKSADGNIIQEDYTDCHNGSEVLVYTLVKGDHYWPTLDKDGLSATDAIWEFFLRHARTD